MSLKQEIETWVSALAAYDNNEFSNALRCFELIADTSRICFNLGIIRATLGEHAEAVACYQKAIQLDQYLAIAYFQQGVSNFLLGDFEEALASFNDTLLYLRGNNNIDYAQLGLNFKLYSCEALFNRGLCYVYLQQKEAGMQDLMYAAKEKMVPDHDVIDEAIKEQADGYTVFSVPVGIVYRPNEAKVKNLKQKDYLGKARLVAQQDQFRADPRRVLAAIGVDDRPSEKLSYAALNLVRPNLTSRSRQQSEPPLQRNLFPPTPPPEPERERPVSSQRTADSPRSQLSGVQAFRPAAKQLRLDLGAAAFEKPRLGSRRTESERPMLRREFSGASARSNDSRQQHREEQPDPYVQADPIQAYDGQDVLQSQTPVNQRSRSSAHALRQTTHSIAEEDEDESTPERLAFEIIPPRSHHRQSHSRRNKPEIRKLRVKVHGEDTRFIMTSPDVLLTELTELVRAKFGLQTAFRLKIKDEEGDMITVSDQDDLDMAVAASKVAAAKDNADMGKMEIYVR